MPRGDGSNVQTAGRVQSPLIGKSPAVNQRLLPQGSGGFMGGRTSALLQGSGAPPARPANYGGYSVDPVPQVPAPHRQAPAVALLLEKNRILMSLRGKQPQEFYFDEALQCVEELKSPAYHPEVVKEAISLGLEKSPPCVDQLGNFWSTCLTRRLLMQRILPLDASSMLHCWTILPSIYQKHQPILCCCEGVGSDPSGKALLSQASDVLRESILELCYGITGNICNLIDEM
ncbi:Eukaryotic translation initiation factor isoform 4G-2 [Sesamum angolense]|uniref:Eukaryotic translation initiation factor isoform 4G-2 n=1 Tax=Sesamum angolense TaxID=2727404 RepID=A0AAE2C0M3_9LAMI|nr:Eukaryotic translation initiation factor isoform 4G-2 [Sesamum angolense]